MPTVFKHAVNSGLGTTPTDVIQIDAGIRATVIGMNLVNITDNVITTNVFVYDSSSTVAYYAKELIIPPNTSLKVITQGEKLILPEGSGLRIASSEDDSIDSTVSYVEIS
jgi:S1-C subfamily serine protease